MASTRRQKHHARFHASVLRHLFPPPPSPPSSDIHQEASKLVEGLKFQGQCPSWEGLVTEETQSNSEEVEVGKALLSRAQRKKFRLKKMKDTQLNAAPAKRLIGPLLPDLLEKRGLESDFQNSANALLQESTNIEKSHNLSISRRDQDFKEMQNSDLPSTITGEELAVGMRETADSLLLEIGDSRYVDNKVERELLSRAKRRRLAKKRFHDSSRCPTAGLIFTAEIKGGDIIIKPVV
ncbi:hypothetical protein L7F22_040871 [Adiantum nelumboides]|nr:hypothetical protein [Adiantum nelumboides]